MEDNAVEKTEEAVAQTETLDVVVPEQPTVDAVVQNKRASLDDIKALPDVRKSKAVPFVIPGTGLEVLVAPCSQSARYKSMMRALSAIKESTDKNPGADDNQRVEIIEAMASSMIKACVVEPALDDEAIAALNEFNASGVTALLEKCREVSGMDTSDDTKAVESFIFGNLLGMS